MSKQSERTFIMIKPDGVQRGVIGNIISRFEDKGYKMVGLKMLDVPTEHCEKHYEEHKERPFFNGLVSYVCSGPVVAMVWEGTKSIEGGRSLIGETNPTTSAPGTIRGDLAMEVGRNLIHGSDSTESAAKEISHWFQDEELSKWTHHSTKWLFE